MSRESYALLTGLFVIALAATLIAMAKFLGSYGEERVRYVVITQGSVAGLNPESSVVYRGVPAGKVTTIRFDKQDVRNILVTIEIDPGLPITHGTYAVLRVQGLTGLAQIELDDQGDHPEPLPSDPESPARIPLRPSLIDKLKQSAEDLVPKLAEVANRLSRLVNDDNVTHIAGILSNMDVAAGRVIVLEDRLNRSLTDVPALTQKGQRMFEEMTKAASDLRAAAREVKAAAQTTQTFAVSGGAAMDSVAATTLPRVDALLGDVKRMTASMRKFSETLEKDPQSLLFGPQPLPPGPGEPGYQESR